ncbi:hypothetical protein E3J74_07105 [Candidatus Bathyarchaeota archaeon]|nr:MAG: hypothetical protein E3J74_07105 [Candidatus Bathyarchaeota archaeon]
MHSCEELNIDLNDNVVIMIASVIALAFVLGVIVFFLWICIHASKYSKPKREYGIKSVTARGEEVRSLAERRIADYFMRNNIDYVYEKDAIAKGLFFDSKISTPDFYLPDYDVYVEYWGLVDADDNWTRERYTRSMKRKMAIYYRNNIKFISLYPRNLENLDWIFRRKFKKVTGFELPN